MYLVIELQVSADGQAVDILTAHNSLAEAESKFYLVLSYAVVSDLALHGATIIDSSDGRIVKHECFSRTGSEVEE